MLEHTSTGTTSDEYVKKALKRFNHKRPYKLQNQPHPSHIPPKYRAMIQNAMPEDHNADSAKYISILRTSKSYRSHNDKMQTILRLCSCTGQYSHKIQSSYIKLVIHSHSDTYYYLSEPSKNQSRRPFFLDWKEQ